MLTTRTIRPHELTLDDLRVWRSMLRDNPELSSPFFLPEFSVAVGAVNQDARIIVFQNGTNPIAFLPFQFAENGEPVTLGGSLNDFQGMIAGRGFAFRPQETLEAAGLRRMFCTKMLDWSHSFQNSCIAVHTSPFIALTGGYAAWERGLQETGGSQLKQLSRKERKLKREHGDVRFEFHSQSSDVLRQLVAWKREQYRRTGECDVLADSWPPELLRSLLDIESNGPLKPALSALYANDELIAAHFGLLSPDVCHWWFPAYNPAFGRYSPGKIMLRHLLFEAAGHGITRFDFGAGCEDYKLTFANESVDVCRVIVDRNPIRRWMRTQWYRGRMTLKRSAVAPSLRKLRARWRDAKYGSRNRYKKLSSKQTAAGQEPQSIREMPVP